MRAQSQTPVGCYRGGCYVSGCQVWFCSAYEWSTATNTVVRSASDSVVLFSVDDALNWLREPTISRQAHRWNGVAVLVKTCRREWKQLLSELHLKLCVVDPPNLRVWFVNSASYMCATAAEVATKVTCWPRLRPASCWISSTTEAPAPWRSARYNTADTTVIFCQNNFLPAHLSRYLAPSRLRLELFIPWIMLLCRGCVSGCGPRPLKSLFDPVWCPGAPQWCAYFRWNTSM